MMEGESDTHAKLLVALDRMPNSYWPYTIAIGGTIGALLILAWYA